MKCTPTELSFVDEPQARKRAQLGMTTIEVVAALLLFSIALVPIMQVQLNAQRGAQIVADVEATASLERRALNYLKTINFAKSQTGNYDFGDGTISWQAELLTEEAQIALGNNRIAMFRVVVQVQPVSVEPTTRTLHAIGWL